MSTAWGQELTYPSSILFLASDRRWMTAGLSAHLEKSPRGSLANDCRSEWKAQKHHGLVPGSEHTRTQDADPHWALADWGSHQHKCATVPQSWHCSLPNECHLILNSKSLI